MVAFLFLVPFTVSVLRLQIYINIKYAQKYIIVFSISILLGLYCVYTPTSIPHLDNTTKYKTMYKKTTRPNHTLSFEPRLAPLRFV